MSEADQGSSDCSELPFHVAKLPETSAFLAGRGPVQHKLGVTTEHVQIYYRRDDDLHIDAHAHAHAACDEFFVVLSGTMTFEVRGESYVIQAGEFCHFPAGVFHRVAQVTRPLEAFVIRAPSIPDKIMASRDAGV